MERIVYKELSYNIVGACFAVQKKLGRFGREKQFSDELEKEFLKRGVRFLREYELSNLAGCDIQGNRVDFLVDEKVIVDVKSKKYITKEDYYQMQRYLKSACMKLGIIVNFRESYLKPKRVLNSDCCVE